MKNLFPVLITFVFLAFEVNAADAMDNRACNLQGREIALRVSEEVAADLNAGQRNRIAQIAEEVCQDYSQATDQGESTELTVLERPAATARDAAQPAEQAVTEAGTVADEDSGLFGDIRVIEPEDRVRRPGLKRR